MNGIIRDANRKRAIYIRGDYYRGSSYQYGIQRGKFGVEEVGIPVEYFEGQLFKIDDATTIDTGWKPDIPIYTIEIEIRGNLEILDTEGNPTNNKSYRTEVRRLVKGSAIGDAYYINRIKQDYVPELPDPNSNLIISNVPPIGYPDVIDAVIGEFHVWNIAKLIPQPEGITVLNCNGVLNIDQDLACIQ